MGMDLMATVLPRRTEQQYREEIDSTGSAALVKIAFNAGVVHLADVDDEDLFDFGYGMAEWEVVEALDDMAKQDRIVRSLRAAALHAAKLVSGWDAGRYSVPASLAGQEILIVGGSTFGDPPFDGFREVELLAAILNTRS